MTDHYEINEKDIESAIRWLRVNDPENATHEKAIAILQDMQSGFHQMAHNNPELLSELQDKVDKNKNS